MTTTRKHTHKGTCQACGRQQAHQLNGLIAKHGYTVDWGFFNGICQGADAKPLELDHSLTDAIIIALRRDADLSDKRAADLTSGTIEPKFFKRVRNEKQRTYGQRNYQQYIDTECTRAELTDDVVAQQIRFAIHHAESKARNMRSHAGMLVKLIDARFGQPLIAVNHEERKELLAVGARVRIGGKTGWVGEVVEMKHTVARGCGPYMNGKYLLHAFLKSPKGNIIAVPARTIRSSAIVTGGAQ
jgi:hypothetical protein